MALQPAGNIPPVVGRFDKFFHAVEFVILYFVTFPAFGVMRRFLSSVEAASLGYALLVGALAEWLQGRIPTRSATLGDWVADAAGASAAFMGLRFFMRVRAERRDG